MTYIRGGEDGDGMRQGRDYPASILIYMHFLASYLSQVTFLPLFGDHSFLGKQNGNCPVGDTRANKKSRW